MQSNGMKTKIIVTEHARQRFAQRALGATRFVGDGPSRGIEESAQIALTEGKILDKSLKKTVMLVGYGAKGYWTADYRVLNKLVYVFQPKYADTTNQKTMTLTTILKLSWLKQRRAEMIKRAIADGRIKQL